MNRKIETDSDALRILRRMLADLPHVNGLQPREIKWALQRAISTVEARAVDQGVQDNEQRHRD